MKNAIYYFYNIIIDNIYQTKTYYYFDHNNEHYVLVTYFDNPNNLPQIYNLHLKLLNNKIYVHQIILNKENNIITIINGTPYILMKTRYFTGKINFNTVLTFSKDTSIVLSLLSVVSCVKTPEQTSPSAYFSNN